jgi:hypothetical protein
LPHSREAAMEAFVLRNRIEDCFQVNIRGHFFSGIKPGFELVLLSEKIAGTLASFSFHTLYLYRKLVSSLLADSPEEQLGQKNYISLTCTVEKDIC